MKLSNEVKKAILDELENAIEFSQSTGCSKIYRRIENKANAIEFMRDFAREISYLLKDETGNREDQLAEEFYSLYRCLEISRRGTHDDFMQNYGQSRPFVHMIPS